MDEYVIPGTGKNLREAVSDRLDALTGFAPYLDGIVQSPCLRELETVTKNVRGAGGDVKNGKGCGSSRNIVDRRRGSPFAPSEAAHA
jgi:hypothetical protein